MRKIILGLVLAIAFGACKKERACSGTTEKTFTLNNFRAVKGGENFAFAIQQGTAFSVKAKGCETDLNDMQLSVDNGGILVINYPRYEKNREKVEFSITLPALERFNLDGVATGTLTGFSQQNLNLRVNLNGAAKCTVNDIPDLLKAELDGASELTVAGSASDLIAKLAGASKMNAYGATFYNADVYTSGTASLRVQVQQGLVALASGSSRIYYKGNPPRVYAEQEGTGKVIRE